MRFDKAGRDEIKDALGSDEDFETFVEREGYEWERHANMEY